MKRFKYKLTPVATAFIIVSFLSCILAIAFSVLKILGLFNNTTDSQIALDVITIIASILFMFFDVIVYAIHYKVDSNGINLKLGFFTVKSNSFSSEEIQAVVYKTKENKLLVIKDLDAEEVFGTIINISSTQYNAFVKSLKDNKICFDYIEDCN